jgi:hypothetical protein
MILSMRTSIKNYLKFLFLFFVQWAYAQSPVAPAFAFLDSNVLRIGDQTTLRLGIDYGEKDRVISITPDIPLDTTVFEIIKKTGWESGGRGRDWGIHRDIVFTAWDTGLYKIPSIVFTIQYTNGEIRTYETRPLMVTVENPKGVDNMTAPISIKEIIQEDRTFEDFLPFVVGLVGLMALGFLIWAYNKKRKAKQVAPVIQQIIHPPHIIAERLLKELKIKQLWQKGEIKDYYSELSYILRGYLEAAFHIPALESTTDELMDTLQESENQAFQGQEEVIEKIQDLLQTADLVKFAKVIPPDTVHDNFWGDAFDIVEKTKPKPIELIDNQGTVETES